MRHLKRGFLIVIIMCSFLVSCFKSNPMERDDLSRFSPTMSEYGVTQSIIPEDFLDKFAYVDGYCCHFCYCKSFEYSISDRALVYIKYDDDIYSEAKSYVFENLELSGEAVETYNGYIFYNNYSGRWSIDYPYKFLRFAYNDSKNALIFIGCYTSNDFDKNIELTASDWGAFLEEYYGDWYDFSQ